MATVTEPAGAPGPTAGLTVRRWSGGPSTAATVLGLIAVVGVVPLAVAVMALRQPRWFPVGDLAMTELRVRDAWTADGPLVGLPGRINGYGQRGSHPGPISFWVLAPLYRLAGSTSWALVVSTATLNIVALGAAIAIAARQGGRRVALGTAAALAVLVSAYGPGILATPWNPYLPVVWWVVFLLSVWSVLGGDLPLLPVAAVTGTFCAQTHISYAGQIAGLAAVGVVALVVAARRQGAAWRRRALGWAAVTAGLLAVMWSPVIAEQLTNSPGNLAIIRESFTHPDRSAIGFGHGTEIWVTGLDPVGLVTADETLTGSPAPGLVVLAGWSLAAVAAWRLRPRRDALVRLHAVAAVALVLGLISASRIVGVAIHYLVLWMWGTTVVVLIASAWTAVAVAEDHARRDGGRSHRTGSRHWSGVATLLASAVVVTAATAFSVDAMSADPPVASMSRVIGLLADDAIATLMSGDAPGGGAGGHYLVRWDDVEIPLGHADGLVLALEREDLDVGIDEDHRLRGGDHRVMKLDEATAVVTFVEGARALARWRDDPDAVEVATADPTADDLAEFARLRRDTAVSLRARGLGEIAERLDVGNMVGVVADPRLPGDVIPALMRMVDLGQPSAVFVTSADDAD